VSTSSFVAYVTASFRTWQYDPNSAVAASYWGTRTDYSAGSNDGVNVMGWGYLGGDIIAVTYMWAQATQGNFDSLRFTETDMIFDNSKLWSAESSGIAGRFDVQNIATHEGGHTFGLGDMYESADSEHTMYGYAGTGETKKRTLEWGDRAGVATLYPYSPTCCLLRVQSLPITGVLISFGPPPDPPSPYMNTPFNIPSGNPFNSGPFTAASSAEAGGSTYLFDHWELDGINMGPNPLGTVTVGSGYPNERNAIAVYALGVIVTFTSRSTVTSTSYLPKTTTETSTSYTGTTTTTSTIPTVTTVALVPLTVTSTDQSTQFLTSVLTKTVTNYTSTTTSTSTIPTTIALVPLTMTSTAQSTEYLTSILTTTVTNYTSTSTNTIPTVTTVALVPSTITATAQGTEYLTSMVTTTVTAYTSTLTSTVPTVTTVGLVPLTMGSTVQSTEYLTSTATTTVTNYTSTTTSTSTSVVYTTVTTLASAGASNPLVYLGFLSLLALTVGRVTTGKSWRIPKARLAKVRTCYDW